MLLEEFVVNEVRHVETSSKFRLWSRPISGVPNRQRSPRVRVGSFLTLMGCQVAGVTRERCAELTLRPARLNDA
jgi:hypothetical protein